MPHYQDRILEIHGPNMWNMFHVRRAVQFAHRYHLTGIAFHCNELIDRVVFPTKYFTKDELLTTNPVRNSNTKNQQYYLRSVLDLCKSAGLEFYAEVKEIYYPHDLLWKYPELRGENGAVCATNPFWWEFVQEKFREFIELFPEVAGVIVSPGTRESMVSFAANKCTCERCQGYDVDDWYRNLIKAMHAPLQAAGKRLIIRDFSYTKKHQYAMVDAAKSVSDDITMAMKKVPHDFYPVFPDNPAIGSCGALSQWVEYDTWGQFFGLGVFPCSVAEDIQGRMKRYLDRGASGVMLRTDWENLLQSSVFCSFNMLNLIAGARLSYDVNTSMDDIYRDWLDDGLFSPLFQDSFAQEPCVPLSPKAQEVLRELMTRSWKILEKIIHVRGHVFHRNCQVFDRYDLTYNIMTVFHRRDDWDPGASERVQPTEENIRIMLEEKAEGVKLAESLLELVKPAELGLTDSVRKYLDFLLPAYVQYAKAFELECRTAVYTRRAELSRDPAHIQAARDTLAEYDDLAATFNAIGKHTGYSHIIEYMFDGDRLLRFKADVARTLDAIQ